MTKLSVAKRVAAALREPGTTREAAIFDVAKALHAAGQVDTIAEGIRQAHACLMPPRIQSARTLHHDWSRARYLLRQQIALAEITQIRRRGGTVFHVRPNKRTGRFEYRRALGRGVWAKRLPPFPASEDARISAAARKVAIRKRASLNGVTARQSISAARKERVRGLRDELVSKGVPSHKLADKIVGLLELEGDRVADRTVRRIFNELDR